MRKLAIITFLCLSLFPLSMFAQQVLRLRDGKTYTGTFVSGDSSGVVFRDSSGVNRRFALNRIQSIDFARGVTTAGVFDADRVGAETEYVIPQGTELSVRTNEAINSETATQGQTFSATVAQDVMGTSGAVVIPRGSPAQMVINEIEGGGITGTPTLALDLRSVTVNGRTYLVNTADVEQRSERGGLGANRRTATMVGGGAALGTVIGAIAGGGRGAAIGAAIGAAGGATTQVLTRGKEVKVPAETMLTFRLDQQLRLEAAP